MTKEWNQELKNKNQRSMCELINIHENNNNKKDYGYLNYNKNPDLEHHSKPVRFIYYILYDRQTFKRRMRESFKSNKILLFIGKIIYKIGAKFKNIIYNIIHIAKGGKK